LNCARAEGCLHGVIRVRSRGSLWDALGMSGYWQVEPEGTARERLVSLEDLATVNRATGREWSVLGRLVGRWSDSVHLLGDGARRAVLKIKLGEWWGGQLSR